MKWYQNREYARQSDSTFGAFRTASKLVNIMGQDANNAAQVGEDFEDQRVLPPYVWQIFELLR
jgi:hypothetical protein